VLAGTAYLAHFLSSGTLEVRVRDAPADWAHVNVTFTEVWIHRAGSAEDDGWTSLSMEPTTIDFIALGNLTQLLALDRVPAGRYTQIRIVISAAEGTLASGGAVALRIPDGILKTSTSFLVPGGGIAAATLDIDLERSLVPTSGGWTFTPVLGSVQIS